MMRVRREEGHDSAAALREGKRKRTEGGEYDQREWILSDRKKMMPA